MSSLSCPTALSPHCPVTTTEAPAVVRVLGCSGSIARDCRTTAFLLDDDVLIDAGSGLGDLALDELLAIDDILLTHSHLDHVLGVPLLADSVMRRREGRGPIRVHGLPQTLQALRQHLFNDVLWPDFTRLPRADRPVLELRPLQCGQSLQVGARRRSVQVLPACHTVPAVGYAVLGARGAWAFTGDTGPCPALWQALRQLPVPLRQLVIEIAFSEADREVAADSRHHCPSSLVAELAQLPAGVEVQLTHIKPGEMGSVLAGLAARLGSDHGLRPLAAGQRLQLP